MHVQYLQHVPFEGPAGIAHWTRTRGHMLSGTHLYRGESLPAPESFDLLVILGGPMGVYDTQQHPWLTAEREFIRQTLHLDTPVCGICLGAQQVAAALGGSVEPTDRPEIGWYPVQATSAATGTCFEVLPPEYIVFHWHGDRFILPPGGKRTAASKACHNQAFVAADGLAMGLQFHIEAIPESVHALVDAADRPDGRWVQSRDTLLRRGPFEALRQQSFALFDRFVQTAVSGE